MRYISNPSFFLNTDIFPTSLSTLNISIRPPFVPAFPIDYLNPQNTLQIKRMLKLKNNASGARISKKTIRPFSACAFVNKKNRSSHLLNNIITSLEKNVNQLKIFSQKKENGVSQEKSQKGFRVKRGMVRNSSQANLQPIKEDRCENDVFEIRNEYLKVNGKLTNNIIELYEFYRKNAEKREKSTRILASMELSGGQSISGQCSNNNRGKESLLKHSQLYREPGRKERDQSKIDEKNEESNNFEITSKSPLKLKKIEKTSVLANDLISKGCYNLMNIANLLNSKKYRLTKQKEESFKRSKNQKNKIAEPVLSKQRSPNKENKENNMNRDNIIRQPQEMSIAQPNEFSISKNSNFNITKSPEFHKRPEPASAAKDQEQPQKLNSKSKSFECSSISKQDKDIQRKIFEETSIKKAEGSNQKNFSKVKPQLQLLQSPIIPKNPKQFQKSKFYVKPIPQKKYENDNSISLRSTSRIIDIDSLPFDL